MKKDRMIRVWSTETRSTENAAIDLVGGLYIRNDDWSVQVEEDAVAQFLIDHPTFTDIQPPEGAFDGVPCDFVDGTWVSKPLEGYEALRRKEYPPIEEMIVALWEHTIEGRSEAADALETKRQNVKTSYPKE